MLIKMNNINSNQIFQNSSEKQVIVKMIDILLVVLQKIIRGTTSISSDIINDKYIKHEIQLLTNQITVTIQHKLQDPHHFDLEDARLKDDKNRHNQPIILQNSVNLEPNEVPTESPWQFGTHSPRNDTYMAGRKCEFNSAMNSSLKDLKNKEEFDIKKETPELFNILYSNNPGGDQDLVEIKEKDTLPISKSPFITQKSNDSHEIMEIPCVQDGLSSLSSSSTVTKEKFYNYTTSLSKGENGKNNEETLNSSHMDDYKYLDQYSGQIEADCLPSNRQKLKNNSCFHIHEEISVMNRDFQGVGHIPSPGLNSSLSKFPAANVSITEIRCDDERNKILTHPEKEEVYRRKEYFKCKYCSKTFGKLSENLEHEKIHKMQKSFPCSYCEKTFTSATNKQIHERVHTGEKPYPCRICGKSFSQRNNRRDHELIHSGVKPHTCQYCGKSFRTLTAINYHEKTHTGEKPHSCSYCSKSFIREIDKIMHEKGHKEERF